MFYSPPSLPPGSRFARLQKAALVVSLSFVAAGSLVLAAGAQSTSGSMRNGLPPTSLDSFVHEAGEYAELIYGDEGTTAAPPYEYFTLSHRINTGIMDTRDQGLTTGHGSYMPSAWGHDEFEGAEWSQSGAQGVSAANGLWAGGSYITPNNAYSTTSTPGPASAYQAAQDNQVSNVANPPPIEVTWNQELAQEGSSQRWIQQQNGSWRNNVTGVTMLADGTQTYVPAGSPAPQSQQTQVALDSSQSGF